jgi:hypothetical protein
MWWVMPHRRYIYTHWWKHGLGHSIPCMHLERILHAHAHHLLDAMHASWIALPADALNLDHQVRLGSLDPVDASWMHLACTRNKLKPSSKTWATRSYTHDQPNIPHTGQTPVKRGYFWSVFSLFDRAPTISKINIFGLGGWLDYYVRSNPTVWSSTP